MLSQTWKTCFVSGEVRSLCCLVCLGASRSVEVDCKFKLNPSFLNSIKMPIQCFARITASKYCLMLGRFRPLSKFEIYNIRAGYLHMVYFFARKMQNKVFLSVEKSKHWLKVNQGLS